MQVETILHVCYEGKMSDKGNYTWVLDYWGTRQVYLRAGRLRGRNCGEDVRFGSGAPRNSPSSHTPQEAKGMLPVLAKFVLIFLFLATLGDFFLGGAAPWSSGKWAGRRWRFMAPSGIQAGRRVQLQPNRERKREEDAADVCALPVH